MKIEAPSDKSFGFTIAGLLTAGAAYSWFEQASDWRWLAVTACVVQLFSLLAPVCLRPFNVLWMAIGHAVSKITNPIVLGIIFFLVVLPVGLLLRLSGKNPLRLKPDRLGTTYWVSRAEGQESTSFTDQF